MRVFIADFDLYQKIGGGQTFYRRIIKSYPSIKFYYLIQSEQEGTTRPPNACAIPFREKYFSTELDGFYDISPPQWVYQDFIKASNIAASIAGQSFDIVDFPDYEQFGIFLRPALKYHQVSFDRIVLSMHGSISTSLRMNWSFRLKETENIALKYKEELQYRTVDVRYGISKTYLREWNDIVELPAQYFNPLHFISLPKPVLYEASSLSPDLNFIGRTEKRKGADIFADIAWWLPRSLFKSANIIGPESYDDRGVSSSNYLQAAIDKRSQDVKLLPAMNAKELERVFGSKSITFLPSRYDTLNLLALESLFCGCPTAIGSGAGVCSFLRESFPHLPFINIDIQEVYSCLPKLVSVLENYDEYREHLRVQLLKTKIEISDPSLGAIYRQGSTADPDAKVRLDTWYSKLLKAWELNQKQKKQPIPYTKSLADSSLRNLKRRLELIPFLGSPASVKAKLKGKAKELIYGVGEDNLRLIAQGTRARGLMQKYRQVFYASEENEKDLKSKLKLFHELEGRQQENHKNPLKKLSQQLGTSVRIDRIRIWREIARIEQLCGNDLIAATYLIRGMRLLGSDRFQDIPFTVQVLNRHSFKQEAAAVQAMYGNIPDNESRCSEILNAALLNNLQNQPGEYEFVDDRRGTSSYKTAIIVSLYNAAKKLPLFLNALQTQTLVQAGQTEIILIDSGSPGNEYAVFKHLMAQLKIPIVYARSRQRETIQSAWNRGIALARAPYLAFLGVDESLLPNALEILAGELEKDPELDWVIGDSLVTNVDAYGTWVNDIMSYDRTAYRQSLVYLETCYLSWVGALYRRSIHDRFGYYDSTFRAAGDTEFKNRVLPFIKTKRIPHTLGIFWNYPEERTTQHPRAEIEDIRAWYLHRTVAGIQYAFAARNPEEAEDLFFACMRYRKSYCQHWSTDIEYADNLAKFIQRERPNSLVLKFHDSMQQLLAVYRELDYFYKPSSINAIKALARARQVTAHLEQKHRQFDICKADPMYRIFNDNRYEQHSNLWSVN
ncbi:MAG: glycosyltransferase [Cyanobacteriota bacterium]|nr:glycosyltransferase [Cyanobacteriota bacterium]